MMSSRLLLLVLAALAACQCSGRSQGDPIPSSLVDLVLNTPISSMDDLKRLLDVESVEEDDEKPENEIHANQTHRRFSRSLSVQVAHQAMCKVRTEVMEVTRAMLDKRNTDFLLWPPCVEVQRCSGCCNTRVLQCVPVSIDTRHLQMTKIKFINRQPVYEKVIIPVEDHVTCSCQPHLSPNAPRLQTTPLPPPRPHPKVTAPKRQSKEELHRHDELKNNQRLHLEDKETHELQWQSKYTLSHTQGYRQSLSQHALTHTPAGMVNVYKGVVPTRQTTLGAPHMMSDETQTEEVEEHRRKPEHHTHVGSGDGTTVKTPTVGQHYTQHHHDEQQSKPQQPHHQTTPQQQKHNPTHDSIQSEHSVPNSGQLDPISRTYSHVEVIGQSSGLSEVLSDHQSEVRKHHHHHHQSETSNDQNVPQEQEMEKHQEETQHHLRHQHHHHQHHHTTQGFSHQQITQQTVTKAPRTTPSAPQTPPPLQPLRKRRRKHRRRMSKASMRAMIMVMS